MKHPALNTALATGVFDGEGDFSDFEQRMVALASLQGTTTKLLGDVFEVFCEAFLLSDPEVDAVEVWPLRAAPAAILKQLRIPRDDQGCDGIYRRKDGNFGAYQAKFRSLRQGVVWRELSTFLAVSERAHQRLLITNSDTVSATAKMSRGFRSLRGSDLTSRGKEGMNRIRALVGRMPAPLAPGKRSPRPHQMEAISDIVSALRVMDRATAVMACGTGKTLTALWAAEQLEEQAIVVLLPSLSLVRQTLVDWEGQNSWGARFRFMCVCSDESVAEEDEDVPDLRPQDVLFDVTTCPERIGGFLSGYGDGAMRVVFTTYQSAARVAEGIPDGFRFGLGIFDEAHKTAGEVGASFSLALHDGGLPIARRLFLTATRRMHKVQDKGEIQLHSMDDESVYGPVVHNLSFARAAALGIILRYKVLVAVVTRSDVAAMLGAGGPDVALRLAGQTALARAVEEYGIRKAFTFHRSVREARAFAAAVPGSGSSPLPQDFEAFHVSGDMSAVRRAAELRRFREAERALVSNARCLTEGVDVPAVDLVAFMSRKESKVDIVQAVGRALRRTDDDKPYGYVLVPLFLDEMAGETIEAAVGRANFGRVWDVLRAMMDQDEGFVDVVDRDRLAVLAGDPPPMGIERYLEVVGHGLPLDAVRQAVCLRAVERLGKAPSFASVRAGTPGLRDALVRGLERRFGYLRPVHGSIDAMLTPSGRRLQISPRSPCRDGKANHGRVRFSKRFLDADPMSRGAFVVWSDAYPRGWMIPMSDMRDLVSLSPSERARPCWDAVIEENQASDVMTLCGSSLDLTPFRIVI